MRQRGHAVDFIGNPYFASLVASAGLSFLPIGTSADHLAFMADSSAFGERRRLWLDIYTEHYFPHLNEFHRAASQAMRPDTIVVIGDEVGTTIAAEQRGVPRVGIALSPTRFGSHYDPPHPDTILPPWSAWCARSPAGLVLFYRLQNLRHGRLRWLRLQSAKWPPEHPISRFRAQIAKFRVEHQLPSEAPRGPALTLCFWPEWFAPPQPDWPTGSVVAGFPMYPLPVPPAVVMPEESRPVVATTGTVAGGQEVFYQKVIEACRQVGRPAVLVSPHADHIPRNLPPGVRYLARPPFNELLGEASLVIHHGGIGTSAYGLAAGVPQVIVPMRGDQFDNGNRLVRLGVARMVSRDRITGRDFARLIDELLTSARVRRQCRQWQSRLDPHEGLRRAADHIEALCAADRRHAFAASI